MSLYKLNRLCHAFVHFSHQILAPYGLSHTSMSVAAHFHHCFPVCVCVCVCVFANTLYDRGCAYEEECMNADTGKPYDGEIVKVQCSRRINLSLFSTLFPIP